MQNKKMNEKKEKILTIDLDGVICGTPYPVKLGVKKKILNPQSNPPKAFIPPTIFRNLTNKIRYSKRPILPNIHMTLRILQKKRRLILLTGRRSSPIHWLVKYNINDFFDDVIFNKTQYASSHYKLYKIQEIGANEHVDDDIQTIQLLNDLTNCQLYLRTWGYNQKYLLNSNIKRIDDFSQLTKLL